MLDGAVDYPSWLAKMQELGKAVNWLAAKTGQTPEETLRKIQNNAVLVAKSFGVEVAAIERTIEPEQPSAGEPDAAEARPDGPPGVEAPEGERPKMAAELEKQGKLIETVQSLENLAKDALAEGIGQGLSYDRSWEQARQICFLPDEQDVPELPNNPLYPTTTA